MSKPEKREWRKITSRKARLWRKLNKNPDVPRPTLAIVGVIMIVLVVFGLAGVYYFTNVVPNSCPRGYGLNDAGRCSFINPVTGRPDPFNTIWNGQTNSRIGTDDQAQSCITACSPVINTVKNNGIFVNFFLLAGGPGNNGACGNGTPGFPAVSDSAGNTYTKINCDFIQHTLCGGTGQPACFDNVMLYTYSATASATVTNDIVTVSEALGTTFTTQITQFTSATTNTIFTKNGALGTNINGPQQVITTNTNVTSSGFYLDVAAIYEGNPFGGSTGPCYANSQSPPPIALGITTDPVLTSVFNICDNLGSTAIPVILSTAVNLSPVPPCSASTCANFKDSAFNIDPDSGNNYFLHISINMAGTPLSTGAGACATNWNCFNAETNGEGQGAFSNDIVLEPTPASSAVAMTQGALDLSPCSAKACAFSFGIDHQNTTDANTVAWFLRSNQTLPNGAWNVLTDSSVVLAFYEYVADSTHVRFYIYMQRQIGQQLAVVSNNPDPYPTAQCPQTSTLFICIATTYVRSAGAPSTVLSLTLNFTGGAQAGGATSGASNACLKFQTAGSATCPLGGYNNLILSLTNANQYLNFTLPWMNLQNNYYAGYYEGPSNNGNGPLGASTGLPGGVCQNCAPNTTFNSRPIQSTGQPFNLISTVTPNTNGQNTEGGFFGWVARGLGGAWDAVSGVVGGAINLIAGPILNFGNNLMSVFISALIQAFTLLIQGLRVLLNAVGSLFGFGTAGDVLVSFFTNIVDRFIQLIGTAFGWGVQVTNLMLAFVNVLNNFLVNGFFTTLVNFLAGPILTILGIIWTIVTAFFKYSVASSYLLLVDWLFGMVYVWMAGLRGFIAWINFNILVFTKFFKGLYWVLNEIMNIVLKIVGTIRGSGTGTGVGV